MTHQNMPKETDIIGKLTEGQKECLRLVYQGYSSKEIALKLNISRYTVDQRVTRAGTVLSATSRRDAARILAEYEQFVYQPIDISESSKTDTMATVVDYIDDSAEEISSRVLNEPPAFAGHANFSLPILNNAPIPKQKGDRYNAAIVEKLTWIALVSIASILTAAILISALETLSRIFSAA